MNREIKLRAWDIANNCYYKPIYRAYKGELHDISVSLSGQVLERTLDNCSSLVNTGNYLLEQFTGLKDKNGIDVYAGDIFNINNKYYFIEYIEDRCRYVLTTGKGYDSKNCIDLDCDEIFGYGIKGNINQNPELLC